MITLASLIECFTLSFLAQYHKALLPSHRQALNAMAHCRTRMVRRVNQDEKSASIKVRRMARAGGWRA